MIYLELLIGFLEVGLFSFGGGYASIPLIRDVILRYGWMDEEMLTYMVAVSESTPGPIMVNLATYVGSTRAGLVGAFIATTAVVTPAFIIVILLTALFTKAAGNPYFKAILGGLIPCIIGIITATGIYTIVAQCFAIDDGMRPDIKMIGLSAVLALIYFASRKVKKGGISPITLIIISAVFGVLIGNFHNL
ncbi:MAG: chromate transporter [Lachnospiraceae bacterium]|nr:chromate transporter [Lachnospiraceae bacterium]